MSRAHNFHLFTEVVCFSRASFFATRDRVTSPSGPTRHPQTGCPLGCRCRLPGCNSFGSKNPWLLLPRLDSKPVSPNFDSCIQRLFGDRSGLVRHQEANPCHKTWSNIPNELDFPVAVAGFVSFLQKFWPPTFVTLRFARMAMKAPPYMPATYAADPPQRQPVPIPPRERSRSHERWDGPNGYGEWGGDWQKGASFWWKKDVKQDLNKQKQAQNLETRIKKF